MKFLKLETFFLLLIALPAIAFAQDTGGVKGKVKNDRGNALEGATVAAKQGDKEVKAVLTNAKGEFVLDGLNVGVYNLVFSKKGYASGTLYNFEVVKKKIRDLSGRNLILSVDQGTLVLVKGSVFDAEGISIPGAKVLIERIMGDGSLKKVTTTYSSESGEFTFKFPEAPAKFKVTASIKGKTGSKELNVDTAAVYRLSISLK